MPVSPGSVRDPANMNPIRVLLCHQHPVFRSSMRALIETEAGIRVLGEAANGREALILVDFCCPDVVVLDMKLAEPTGITAARSIISKLSHTGIIFVATDADTQYILEAFKAGARGYVLAQAVPSELKTSIRVVANGERFLSAGLRTDGCEGLHAVP